MALSDNFQFKKLSDNFQFGNSNTPINLTNSLGGTQTSTPIVTNTNPFKQGISAIGNVIGAVLPGAKAAYESVKQGSFQPYNQFLADTNKKLSQPVFLKNPDGTYVKTPEGKFVVNKEGLENLTNIVLGVTGAEGANVIKELAKEKALPKIVNLLKQNFKGISDDVVNKIAPTIAKTSDEGAINSLLNKELKLGGINLTKPVSNQLQSLEQKTQLSSQLSARPISSNSFPDNTSNNDPVKSIIQALKEAKPVRKEQEALYSAERSKRIAQAARAGESIPGEQGYFAQLGALKGELPKTQFDSIRSKITQPHIDELFNMVEKSNITPFEKISAKTGLSKMIGAEGGIVPTKGEISLLSEIFPPEFIQEVMNKRPFMEKLWGNVANALNLPRAVMATADLSAPLRQGVFLLGKPKQWARSFTSMFRYAFSENAYKGLLDDIRSRPTYHAMRESKLAITDLGPVLTNREEAFMSNLVEKLPLFGRVARGSNRAYSGFLNKLRADVFDDLVGKATKLGITQDNPNVIDDIAKFVNTASGRGDLPDVLKNSTELLNATFFSPRLMASRIQSLNPVYYTKLDPFVRKEALKSLFTLTGVGLTVLGLAKLAGADVGTDPRSADFGKIKSGDTRYDPWGGFQQYMVLASRLVTGQMVSSTTGKEFNLGEGYKPTTRLDIIQRFFESKTSPIGSFALGLLKGQTTMGEDLNIPAEVADRFLPMIAQDMFDLYREYGPEGLGLAIPGVFGVGSQTYSDQIPMKSKTPTGAESIKWRQAPGLGESIINKVTGKQVTTIPEDEQEKLRKEKLEETIRQADLDRAKKIVLETGEPQTVGDTYVFLDNGIVKTSTSESALLYSQIQALKAEGKIEEAKKIIQGLTDEEYKKYETYKKTRATNTLKKLLEDDPVKAVEFLREQTPVEQQRLLRGMDDEEYQLYEEGKKLLQ